MSEENKRNEYETFELLTRFRETLIRKILNSLKIKSNSRGLDIGCGIGYITKILSEIVGSEGHVVGFDYSTDFIEYAKSNTENKNIVYHQGDVNQMSYDQNSFDWIWSMDTLWVGPKEFGCPTENPNEILRNINRILKPDGTVYLAFWSSQKFLPGFPLLEARLNATVSANTPYSENMKPENHIFNVKKWLSKAGFINVETRTYIYDISAPLSNEDKTALNIFFHMFWGNSEIEVSQKDWEKFTRYCSSESEEYILNSSDYYGFFTYTLFQGQKHS
jgi:ubiquinone/menaquinone biosynthesis C-methylase UbiE